MIFDKALERSFAITDRALRQSFPDDYHKRCMYAAFGLQTVLGDLGFEASILGGDMLTFMVSRSQRQAGMQGFANSVDGHAHYWVEAAGRLIDVGPHYLERDSSYPAETVPLIAWNTQESLPPSYRMRSSKIAWPSLSIYVEKSSRPWLVNPSRRTGSSPDKRHFCLMARRAIHGFETLCASRPCRTPCLTSHSKRSAKATGFHEIDQNPDRGPGDQTK